MILALPILGLSLLVAYAVKRLLDFFHRLDNELGPAFTLSLADPNSLKPIPVPSISQPASKALTVVVPAYNEEERLPATLDELLGYLRGRRNKHPDFTYEVVVVDDGSKDTTAAVAFEYVRSQGVDAVRLLRLPRNCGKGMAVREGVLIARGALVLFMDADGATRVSDMQLLEQALSGCQLPTFGRAQVNGPPGTTRPADPRGPVGAAVGSRAHLEQTAIANRSKLRNFLMHGFHLLVTFVAGHDVKDTQCGFKMFTRRAAAALYANQRLQRWCFDVELVYLARRLGVPISEVQVHWTEMPGSKIRFTSILHMAFELATLKLAYQWLRVWRVYGEGEARPPAPAAAAAAAAAAAGGGAKKQS